MLLAGTGPDPEDSLQNFVHVADFIPVSHSKLDIEMELSLVSNLKLTFLIMVWSRTDSIWCKSSKKTNC